MLKGTDHYLFAGRQSSQTLSHAELLPSHRFILPSWSLCGIFIAYLNLTKTLILPVTIAKHQCVLFDTMDLELLDFRVQINANTCCPFSSRKTFFLFLGYFYSTFKNESKWHLFYEVFLSMFPSAPPPNPCLKLPLLLTSSFFFNLFSYAPLILLLQLWWPRSGWTVIICIHFCLPN